MGEASGGMDGRIWRYGEIAVGVSRKKAKQGKEAWERGARGDEGGTRTGPIDDAQ